MAYTQLMLPQTRLFQPFPRQAYYLGVGLNTYFTHHLRAHLGELAIASVNSLLVPEHRPRVL